MKVLLIADIHSNLDALDVIEEEFKKADQVWCLGDLVGYGPEPNEVIEKIFSSSKYIIAGNHDYGSINKIDISYFNSSARLACIWTKNELTEKNIGLLENLPQFKKIENNFLLVHGSPSDPIWEYILNIHLASSAFSSFNEKVAFVGHTHIPAIFTLDSNKRVIKEDISKENEFSLDIENKRYIINPGSIGQPRDGDPRLSYILFDIDKAKLYFQRQEYNIQKTQLKMNQKGLPLDLALRLSQGL